MSIRGGIMSVSPWRASAVIRQSAPGRALRSLQQVLIDLGRISPAIQPAGNLIDEPLGAIGVEPLREIPAALAWVYVKGAGSVSY
jgi:hypothetical protein